MIDKSINTAPMYFSPTTQEIRITTGSQMLAGSLDGYLSSNDWNDGSESIIGFGDED